MAVLAVWLAVDTRRRRRYIRSTSTQISCHIHSRHELGIEATLWENEPREKADADLDLLQMVRPGSGTSSMDG